MTLMIVKAEDVRDGEPRWWFVDESEAAESLRDSSMSNDELHVAERLAFKRLVGYWPKAAIVDRPAPPPTAAPVELDAWQRATGCVSPDAISEALAGIAAKLGRLSTEGIPDAIDRINAELRAARAEIAALRAKVAEVRELIDDTEHESTCTIGPYGPGQSSADCNCTVGLIAAALEAL